MMVTVSISTDALSSVFISPDLSDTNSFHQCCWSFMPEFLQTATVCSQHTCIILLHQTDTALTTQQTDIVSAEQSVGDSSLIQL